MTATLPFPGKLLISLPSVDIDDIFTLILSGKSFSISFENNSDLIGGGKNDRIDILF